MSVSLRPILIHTAVQTGVGALAAVFYNGQTPLSKLIFGESPTPITPLTGAVFGASSALFFHASNRIFTKANPEEEIVEPRDKMKHLAFIIYTGILAATIFTRITGFPLSFKTGFILYAAMVGTVVEIILASVVAASPLLVGLGCYYGLRWIRR